MNNCLVCKRIDLIKEKNNPYFIAELETGYVVLADHQTYRGYTLFLCKRHACELHELEPLFRQSYLAEMSQVAHAVYKAFYPNKLNYELLGNTDPHLHWHIIPRMKSDIQSETGIWAVPKEKRSHVLSGKELAETKKKLLDMLMLDKQLQIEQL